MVALPLHLNLFILTLSIVAGLLEGSRLLRSTPDLTLQMLLTHAPYLYTIVPGLMLALIAGQAILTQPDVAWQLPIWLAYGQSALAWSGLQMLFTFACSVVVTVAFRTAYVARWGLVAGGVVVWGLLQGMQWQATRPVAPLLSHVTAPDGVIVQSRRETCAAVVAANILRTWGTWATERDMAAHFGTARGRGTSVAQVIVGMRRLGIDVHRVTRPGRTTARLPTPAMLLVEHPDAGREAHAVAYMGIARGKAELWDPLVGKRFLSPQALGQIWRGRALVFHRPPKAREAIHDPGGVRTQRT